ncbi:MAG: hypothetical protein FWG39_01105 [Alphaproteobacteria bacterium]|nr:hypothetical protein [Alphaproteobacteria bacterium]
MKKILLTSALCLGVFASASAAEFKYYEGKDWNEITESTFNPTFRPTMGMWALTTGAAFQTGQAGDSQDSFSRGGFIINELSVKYGVMDELYVSFEMNNNDFLSGGMMASPEIGINWQVMRPAKSVALDVIGKYGLAWNNNSTVAPDGTNNLQAGLRVYGDEGRFQWAGQALAQMAFANEQTDFITDSSTMWNVLMKAELEFEIMNELGLKLEGNYNIYNLAKNSDEAMLYDRNLMFGVIYDVVPHAAIMPYVGYHFQTANSENNDTMANNFWQFGAKFGVQF